MFRNPAALAERRWRGDGPDYVKTTQSRSGRVFYKRSAIEKWLEDRTVTQESQQQYAAGLDAVQPVKDGLVGAECSPQDVLEPRSES